MLVADLGKRYFIAKAKENADDVAGTKGTYWGWFNGWQYYENDFDPTNFGNTTGTVVNGMHTGPPSPNFHNNGLPRRLLRPDGWGASKTPPAVPCRNTALCVCVC